jgi:hypothetical protein
MKVIGVKTVQIHKLTLPGDFRQILEDPRVAELAESIESLALLHAPTVRMPGYRLVAGRHRVAAHVLKGRKTMPCQLVECTDYEAKLIEHHENLRRRDDPEERKRREQELLALLTADEAAAPSEPERGPGRPVTPKGRARRKLAAARGVKPETIRREEYPAHKPKDEAPIRTLGIELGAEWIAGISALRHGMRVLAGRLEQAQRDLAPIRDGGWFPKAVADAMHERIREAAADARASLPVSVCPWCKVIDAVTPTCVACLGRGYVVQGQISSVPPQLWIEGDGALVHYRGEIILAAEVPEEP